MDSPCSERVIHNVTFWFPNPYFNASLKRPDDAGRCGFQMENLRGGEIGKYFAWEGELKHDIQLFQLSIDDGEKCRGVVVRHGEYAFAFQ
ncbi:hypothetical protein SAMN06295888_101408 [Desulfonatronum zhilinae]|nr:hypothetical protein SAMN06295888_101408 [Desulfonatronum zhilinae]